jgi:hypothetical protein
MVKAVIYIPAGIDGYGRFCREGTGYVVRCEYEYAGHVRDPDLIDYLPRDGSGHRRCAPEPRPPGRRQELADRADPPGAGRPAAQRGGAPAQRPGLDVADGHRAGRQGAAAGNVCRIGDEGQTVRLPSARYVRSVIFGDAPAPSGMDPGMIAAARRIARRLRPN